jgi:hypothetical protein
MCEAFRTDLFTRAIKRLLAFANGEYFGVQRFGFSFAPHPFKQRTPIGNQWHTAQFPILRASRNVAPHNNLASRKINIAPFQGIRFAQATSCERQTCREVGAIA